ncbi:hypothetical protein ABZ570_00620 [Micromonospora sp. NPDC007271]|uniref:hypothetical protein n=1 Tax=Micromonospora sp. NPDC007271 TaxID=3154587 RepID=UPI00340D7363
MNQLPVPDRNTGYVWIGRTAGVRVGHPVAGDCLVLAVAVVGAAGKVDVVLA